MSSELHIGIFGRRNQGKSSLINLLTGQQVSIVSPTPGTTTDPVKKSCELAGVGKCILVDTAGFDDDSQDLGKQRVARTREMIRRLDLGLLLISENMFTEEDKVFASYLQQASIPFVIVHNKTDEQPLSAPLKLMLEKLYPSCTVVGFSVKDAVDEVQSGKTHSEDACSPLMDALQKVIEQYAIACSPRPVLKGMVSDGDMVVLVCPIDGEAPKDRLILPQVMITRQCLDLHAVPILCQVEELSRLLSGLNPVPALVITDSQAFSQVSSILPPDMPLTSFSICMAGQKGNFQHYIDGTKVLDSLEDGNRVLILESCTHQVNCNDIGRVKLPSLLRKKSGRKLEFTFVSGLDPLPEDLSGFTVAIQCGGCMVSDKQLGSRVQTLLASGLPVSNYGMALAWCNGIFERAIAVF